MENRVSKFLREAGDFLEEYGAVMIIVAVVAILACVILYFFGFAIISIVLVIAAVVIAFVGGQLNTVAGSFIVSVLLKFLSLQLKQLSTIWILEPTRDQIFAFVDGTSYVTMFLLVFLIAFVIRIVLLWAVRLLESIQLVRTRTNVTVHKQED